MSRHGVLVASVGGASLGSELVKALRLADRYAIHVCDISPLAFGLYDEDVVDAHVVDSDDYVSSVLEICERNDIRAVVPGSEGAMRELSAAGERFSVTGASLIGNGPDVVALCSDKARLFEKLAALGAGSPPWTTSVSELRELDEIEFLPPRCVVKPAQDSGGSSLVFLGSSPTETRAYVRLLVSLGRVAVVQEYVPDDDGEFTIGVLSLPDGSVAGSVALRRLFHVKLSVAFRSAAGVISSGYSQGLIDDFPELREQAEATARALGSTGPLNVQGRVCEGRLQTFEINPRFSASTYLRALAGFNEIDVLLQFILTGERVPPAALRPGYYLRSLDERYVPTAGVLR